MFVDTCKQVADNIVLQLFTRSTPTEIENKKYMNKKVTWITYTTKIKASTFGCQ